MKSPCFSLILIQKILIFKAARLLKHALTAFTCKARLPLQDILVAMMDLCWAKEWAF
jgi:hypothetical protein